MINAEGPPVPIPNTEVKLCSAENTCRATDREDRSMLTLIVGVFNAEGPPVPIPNTEVKLCSAENTCRATDRENKSMPTPFRKTEMFSCLCIEERTSGQSPVRSPQNASLAQLAEHVTVNHGVVGSSPSRGAKRETESVRTPFSFCCFLCARIDGL